METKKLSRPNSEDKRSREKAKPLPKQNPNTSTKVKRVLPKKEIQRSVTPPLKSTLIPKLKSEGNKANGSPSRNVKNTSSCVLSKEMQNEDLDEKLRLLEAKEKSIAEYYEKIKELNGKVLELQKGCFFFDGSKTPKAAGSSTTSFTRHHASDGIAFSLKEGKNELLSNFERNINQISDVWLKTSLDLSNILNNFKDNPSLDSDQFQIENSKIQQAIQQAKSLTLMKTKNVIADAKKLLKDGTQNELEDLTETCKGKNDMDVYQKEGILGGAKSEERGDSKMMVISRCTTPTTKTRNGSWTKDGNSENFSGEATEKKSTISTGSTQSLTQELAKKNETITLLNNKIFEIQKACNEHLLENSQLQYKIAQMNEKNQWNQVIWKQISKLKDRIKVLQQNNKQLEAQKKELESKLANMSVEVEKVTKLNHMLRQQKIMRHDRQANAAKEETPKSDQDAEAESNSPPSLTNTFVLREKENIIEELKNILVLMKGQETFAHQKISEFETKIEEFKKYHS